MTATATDDPFGGNTNPKSKLKTTNHREYTRTNARLHMSFLHQESRCRELLQSRSASGSPPSQSPDPRSPEASPEPPCS